jgi:hypothetical protein
MTTIELNLKTLYHIGMAVEVPQTVLDELRLTEGQRITEMQFWQCMDRCQAIAASMAPRRATRANVADASWVPC